MPLRVLPTLTKLHRQCRLETAVREQKGMKAMYQASGDPLAVRECNERIKRYKDKYAEISDITGIAQDKKRMTLTKSDKSVDNSAGSGIIDNIKSKQGVQDVHYIGKIDKNIYKCVTEDIRTDEVIITDERIQHIKDRHPNDYELYNSYIVEVISNPDYIIEANKNNTAVLLKEIEKDDEKFKLILRLAVKSAPKEYKNSVLSFWEIGETTWKKTLKNKKILYKSE